MATASQTRSESKLSLEIRTKSIEQTLVPLVTQVGGDLSCRMHAIRQLPVAADVSSASAMGFYQGDGASVERFALAGGGWEWAP